MAGSLGTYAQGSDVIRVNAAGTAVEYTTQMTGSVISIAVDASGEAFVMGNSTAGAYLARLAPDGSTGFNTPVSALGQAGTVTVDQNGNAVALSRAADGSLVLQRFNFASTVTLSSVVGTTVPSRGTANFGLDMTGNA